METKGKLSQQWKLISNEYKLLDFIGEGSFGQVVRAKNRKTGEKVGIKLIANIQKSTYYARKVLREITILRKLQSNIFTIKLLDVIIPQNPKDAESFDDVFLVMSLMP